MKNRIRKLGDWNQWRSTHEKHQKEILAINIAAMIAIFTAFII